MNLTAPSPFKGNNHTYMIESGLDKENNKIVISCQITSNLFPFYYELSLEFDDFIKLNKNFKVYDSIDEINSFINESIQEKKVSIKREETDEKLKLSLIIYNLKGIEENVEIILEKKELEEKEIIKKLIGHVNSLIDENRNLSGQLEEAKGEINSFKNIIHHKMDSLIIKDEKEQQLLENRLNKIEIFSGKKFLTRLLFRASVNGDKARTFHSLCNYKNNLLFLVKTNKDYRFGGFTSKSVSPEYHDKLVYDDNAFCFSLNLHKIYNIKKNKEAIYVSNNSIITFLMDIFKIFDNFFSTKSICTDSRDKKYVVYDNQSKNFEINGGEGTFLVKELEVFEIIFI